MPKSPTLPTMLYDGDCGFCQKWIAKWKRLTRGKVLYLPYQKSLREFPQLTAAQCRKAVQLLMPDGQVLSGAHAVFHALALAGQVRVLLWMYEHLPPFTWTAEVLYQWIAHHRFLLSAGSARACRVPPMVKRKTL